MQCHILVIFAICKLYDYLIYAHANLKVNFIKNSLSLINEAEKINIEAPQMTCILLINELALPQPIRNCPCMSSSLLLDIEEEEYIQNCKTLVYFPRALFPLITFSPIVLGVL
jgi:hypothetical protein